MNVSLTPELERYVRRKVASGLYNNASEVIREALRVLLERERAPASGLDRGPPQKRDVRARVAALEKPLRERGVKSVAIFGSVVHEAAGPDSDIDVLVDIEPQAKFSLVVLMEAKNYLEDHLHRKVDVVTKEGLAPAVRERVLREAETVF